MPTPNTPTTSAGHGWQLMAMLLTTLRAWPTGLLLIAVGSGLVPHAVQADTVTMVAAIDPASGSNPSSLVNVNGTLFFAATNAMNGIELWKSDGTAAGTVLVKDITAGPASSRFIYQWVNVAGTLFFEVNDGVNGYELWKSDGTAAGTVMVKDINPGVADSNPSELVNVNGTLFFSANDGVNGRELWKSDGTAAGTAMVKDINPGAASSAPSSLVNANGTLFFSAFDGVNGVELWKSDGTAAGTIMVKDILPGSDSGPTDLVNVNGTVFFRATHFTGYQLWKSDGTAAGTVLVKQLANPALYYSANVNGTLFFWADDNVHGFELWKSDGTTAGTVLVKDINPGQNPSGPTPLVNVNGTIFFGADDGVNGYELWKSDGTTAGTVMLKDIWPGSVSSGPSYLVNVNGTLLFRAWDGVNGIELWRSDGTAAGTVLVKDINPGENPSWAYELVNVNGTLFFQANDGLSGPELWKSDGTAAGTVLVKDIVPATRSSWPNNLFKVNGTLFFGAIDAVNGAELWKSDGTAGGTMVVKDIYQGTGSSDPSEFANLNGTLFFKAYNGVHGYELWKSGGTAAGTMMVKDINPGANSSYPFTLTAANGKVFFEADDGVHGSELWMSDGTTAGTARTGARWPSAMLNVNGTLFFRAYDGVNGYELWKSDGTAASTVMVKDINPGTSDSFPVSLANVNGTVFFQAASGGYGIELWKSDGTAAGTVMVKDINPGPADSQPYGMVNVNGTVFFKANDGVHGAELWKSDGTTAGTVMVKDINPGVNGSFPAYLINVNGTLFFAALDGVSGGELWKSDGTAAGTVLVKDINPGAIGSAPYNMVNVNGTLYFQATNAAYGTELWKSDGTSAGTVLVMDIWPGPNSSDPSWLANVNGTLFFAANDGAHGIQLWKDIPSVTYGLAVNVSGSGAVARNPDANAYDPGASVTLTATPDSGWNFAGWAGDATGTQNPLTVIMTTNKSITARFVAQPGLLDTAFDPGTGPNGSVSALAFQPDGKLIIGGFFTTVNGITRNRVARLKADGSVDGSFDSGSGPNLGVQAVAVQPDGKILIGGGFTSVNGTSRTNIARLNTNGSLDATFDPSSALTFPCGITQISLQADGKILIAGCLNTPLGGTHVARLNQNGSFDASFSADAVSSHCSGCPDGTQVNSIIVQPNGSLLLGGLFDLVNGVNRSNVARLNASGALDSFNPNANDVVKALALQPDNKLFAGGYFTTVGGVLRRGVARFNTDGNLDPGFAPGAGVTNVLDVALQPDGKLLVGGAFGTAGGASRFGLARFHGNGALDASFQPVITPSVLRHVLYQPDTSILIAGDFTSVNGVARAGLARLYTGPILAIVNQPLARTNSVGSVAPFSISAVGLPPLAYQWRHNGTSVPGATSSAYTILSVQGNDAGAYDCVVTDGTGSSTSSVATLTVVCGLTVASSGGGVAVKAPEQPAYLVNTPVTVLAVPNTGWQLAGWSGDASGTANPLNLVMTTNKSVLAVFTNAAQSCAPAPVGLVSWWQAEGDANDAVRARPGFASTIPVCSTGKVGQAFSFGGSNDWISVESYSMYLPREEVTIEFWQKANSIRAQFNLCLSTLDSNGRFDVSAPWSDGKVYFRFGALPTGMLSYLPTNSIVGSWQHFAFVSSAAGQYMKIYRNGVLEAQKSGASAFASSSLLHLQMGGRLNNSYAGLLDEVTVYSRALSDAEIAAIYNAGSAGKCPPPCAPAPTGLVSWWPGAGNGKDAAGSNDGTVTNTSFGGNPVYVYGKVGRSFYLKDAVIVPDSPSLDPGVGPFTLEVWISVAGAPERQVIASKYECGGSCPVGANSVYSLETYGDASSRLLHCTLRDSAANLQEMYGTRNLQDSIFHHVAMVRNTAAGQLQLYVDGALDATATLTVNGPIRNDDGAADPLVIGAEYIGGTSTLTNSFWGAIDELSYYNRALATEEIQGIYNAGTAGKCLTPLYITGISRTATQADLSWLSQKGMPYRAQYKTNPAPNAPWNDLGGEIIATNSTTLQTDIAADPVQRFYRIQLSP